MDSKFDNMRDLDKFRYDFWVMWPTEDENLGRVFVRGDIVNAFDC